MFALDAMNKTKSIFDSLKEMDAKFYLTGSQYFIGQGNDWDFFVQNDGGKIINELKAIGFQEISKKNYGDSLCIAVLRAFDFGNTQIDVQVVMEAWFKNEVQIKMKEIGLQHPTQNEWNLAFKLMNRFLIPQP